MCKHLSLILHCLANAISTSTSEGDGEKERLQLDGPQKKKENIHKKIFQFKSFVEKKF